MLCGIRHGGVLLGGAPGRENQEEAVGGWGSCRGGRENRVVCGVISRSRTRLDASLTPSEETRKEGGVESILDFMQSKEGSARLLGSP